IEAKIRCTLRRIPKGKAAQKAVAFDCVQVTAYAVALVIKCRSYWLTDAGRVVAVASSPRHARDQCGTQKPLRVYDIVEMQVTDAAQAGRNLAHGGRRIQRLSPAPP